MSKKVSSPFGFLPLYNFLSALSWGYVLYNVVSVYPKIGQPQFYSETRDIVTYIQCGAVIEILNSAIGLVRSPLLTTVAQVASRLLIVLGVFQTLSDAEATKGVVYITLLTAWSITEVVRYLFYFFSLCSKEGPPAPLTFLRYNLFLVLYPLGVSSELLIIYSALPLAESTYGSTCKRALIASMLAYIPGFPVLFGHMLAQRRKVMKSLNSGGSKKTK